MKKVNNVTLLTKALTSFTLIVIFSKFSKFVQFMGMVFAVSFIRWSYCLYCNTLPEESSKDENKDKTLLLAKDVQASLSSWKIKSTEKVKSHLTIKY